MGKLEVAIRSPHGMGFVFLWLGPKLGAKPKLREAGSYSSSPGHFEPIGTEVVNWLPDCY